MGTFSATQSAKGTGISDFVSSHRMITDAKFIEHEKSTPANA
jgi:hypothetical protein